MTTPSQTCQHCRHWVRHGSAGVTRSNWRDFEAHGLCENIEVTDLIDGDCFVAFETPEDFGCNKFAPKIERSL